MNERTNQGKHSERDEETMARLLRLAGPRSAIPPEIEARVYERVQREWKVSSHRPDSARVYKKAHRAWSREVSGSRQRRWALPLVLAATVVLAVAVVLQSPPPVRTNVSIGSVARVIANDSMNTLPLSGQQVYPGDELITGAGQGISLVLSNGESLRLDENTAVVVNGRDQFRLGHGRVYADTDDFIYRDRGLVIETAMGSVTDVGTQFAVATGADHLDVAVREGRVDVSQGPETFVAVAGERMRLARDDGVSFDLLEPHDAYWDWATSLAPAFDIENKSLLDFLRWAARETGRELVFGTDELRMSAMRTDLHGSVADFAPLEAVESVLVTTTFRYHIEPDKIVIDR